MFMGKLTAGLVRERQNEFKNVPALHITEVDDKSRIPLGRNFHVEFFHVNHTIPDSFGIAVYTPVGLVIHTGDFKIDYNPVPPDKPANLAKYANLGNQGILALLMDSTNADSEGHQISENDVRRDMEKIFLTAPGRIVVGTFASQIARIQILLDLCYKHNRKIIFEGRSMVSNVEIAHKLGYLKIYPGQVIEEDEAMKIQDKNLVIAGTGAQGQDRAFLVKFAQDEHKYFSVQKNDTIIFSSSVIPGNERTVQNLKDTFCKKGAKVIHTDIMDVHAGGHAKKEDTKLMLRLMRPRYFVPIEATQYKLKAQEDNAKETGIPEERILIPENGRVLEFSRTSGYVSDKTIPSEYIFVDGLGVDDVNEIVLRDRQMMSEDGMFVVIATVDKKTGALIGSPDIISRGFIYMKENKKLIELTRSKVKKILTDRDPKSSADDLYIKGKIRNEIGAYLYNQTKRRPMVLPVVIEV